MTRATLTRLETGDEGTFGEILAGDFRCRCIELPWRNNLRGLSCLPKGVYTFFWRTDSPRHGACYEALPDDEAPGRTNVQIHAANLAGDVRKGWVSQLEGCLAPGLALAVFPAGTHPAGARDQRGVVSSRQALHLLEDSLGRKRFELDIRWAPGVEPTG